MQSQSQSIMEAMDKQRYDPSKRSGHRELLEPVDGIPRAFKMPRANEEDSGSDLSHDDDILCKNNNILVDIAQALKRSCVHVIPALSTNASRLNVSTAQKAHNELQEKENETDTLLDVQSLLSEKHSHSTAVPPLPPVPFPGTRETKAGTEITDVFEHEHHTTVRTILRPRPSLFNIHKSKFRTGGCGTENTMYTDDNCADAATYDSLRPRVLSAPTSPSGRIGFHFGSLNCLSTDAFEEQVDAIQEDRTRAMRGENIEIFCEKTKRVVEEEVPVAWVAI